MTSLLQKKVWALQEALKTVQYQITNLQKFYSKEQVYTWKVQRFKIKKQLAFHEALLKAQKGSNQFPRRQNVKA